MPKEIKLPIKEKINCEGCNQELDYKDLFGGIQQLMKEHLNKNYCYFCAEIHHEHLVTKHTSRF